jgi:hypothetical protein
MGQPLSQEQKDKYHSLCEALQDAYNSTEYTPSDIEFWAAVKQADKAMLAYQSELEQQGYQIEYFCNAKLGQKQAQYIKWSG